MSRSEVRLASVASPARARSLLTVRAAISSAVSSLLPRSSRPSLMCSYWRSRLALHRLCGMAILLSHLMIGRRYGQEPLSAALARLVASARERLVRPEQAHLGGVGLEVLQRRLRRLRIADLEVQIEAILERPLWHRPGIEPRQVHVPGRKRVEGADQGTRLVGGHESQRDLVPEPPRPARPVGHPAVDDKEPGAIAVVVLDRLGQDLE